MIVRPLEPADWDAVFPVFADVVAAGRTYAYPDGLTSAQARGLWVEPPPGQAFVAVEADGTLLGTAKSGPNRPGRGAHVATASFMVAPQARGRGVARALAEHVLSWARAQGYAAMQFNAVVETNAAAVHLWQELGFTIIGTVPEAFDDAERGRVGLHVLHRYL